MSASQIRPLEEIEKDIDDALTSDENAESVYERLIELRNEWRETLNVHLGKEWEMQPEHESLVDKFIEIRQRLDSLQKIIRAKTLVATKPAETQPERERQLRRPITTNVPPDKFWEAENHASKNIGQAYYDGNQNMILDCVRDLLSLWAQATNEQIVRWAQEIVARVHETCRGTYEEEVAIGRANREKAQRLLNEQNREEWLLFARSFTSFERTEDIVRKIGGEI